MINFLVWLSQPYQQTSWMMIVIEAFAALTGILSVYFSYRRDIKVYLYGLVSTAIYVYLLYKWQLFGDMLLNFYYIIINFYGIYVWSKRLETGKSTINVDISDNKEKLISLAIFITSVIVVSFVYGVQDKLKGYAFIDILTTALFFCGVWLMARCKVESWYFWIIGNVISIPLYLTRGYGITAFQYVIFLILAILGYREWKRNYQAPHTEKRYSH